jgi:hypothetical protein
MKKLAQLVSVLALLATILPPLLFFADQLSLAGTKAWMAGAMLLWYLSTPFWMQIKPTE